jgi:hypothetical protein
MAKHNRWHVDPLEQRGDICGFVFHIVILGRVPIAAASPASTRPFRATDYDIKKRVTDWA